MCRVFGCVAAEPASIRHELIEADNPLIRQSEEHDSGWGMAVYERADGLDPRCVRFAEAAFSDAEFVDATVDRGPHLQRPRAAGHDGRPRAREHAPVLPRQLLVRPQRHDPALPAAARAPERRAARPATPTPRPSSTS